MTPSMNMGAPKGTQAPAAGLAAIAQPAQAPKGKSPENMGQIMALARKMSDAQLADVLNGRSLDVPQFAAMTEAMGRKSLRTAVQGQQAMAQAKQPSLKEKLMAEQQPEMMPQGMPAVDTMGNVTGLAGGGAVDMNESADAGGGIAELPAPNMMPMTMAGGGIVAFDEGGEVQHFYSGGVPTKEELDAAYESYQEAKGPWYLPTPRGSGAKEKEQNYKDLLKQYQAVQGTQAQMAPRTTPTIVETPNQGEIDAIRATNVAPGPTRAQVDQLNAKPKISGLEQLLNPQDDSKKAANDYLAQLAGVGAKTRGGIADIKNQGQAQILLDSASALLGSRNLAEAGSKAGQLIAGRVGSMGKDTRALEKEANEYDLNLGRYRAALESGDQDRALQLRKMLLENQYHMAMVNKPDSGIAMLNALKVPENMDIFKQMKAATKPTDVIPKATALKEYNDNVKDINGRDFKKRYPNFDSYYNELTGGTGGGGTDLQSQAAAILALRNK